MDEDSDSESEQESSDSDTDDKIKPKNLLDGILTAARSWSTDGRWEKVLNETSELKAHKIVQQTRDPRDTVVGEPPPVKGDLDMANPYPSPAESGNKVNYPAREPHTYIEALHRPLPKHHPQRVQKVRQYLDRKDHGKMNIQNLFKDDKINLDTHRVTDMEKGETGKHELGKI